MLLIFAILLIIILVVLVRCIVIVPQSNAYVTEWLGVYKDTWGAGLHIRTPFVERISRKVSLKEEAADFPPQPVITRDNVTMMIDTVVFFQVFDAKMYAYGVNRPIQAIENLSATTLRDIIGSMTLDDLTKETVAEAFGDTLAFDETEWQKILDFFARTNRRPTENNRKQAMCPTRGHKLINDHGTAPGAWFEDENGHCAALMPGVPREMKAMWAEQVRPILLHRQNCTIHSRTLRVLGGESAIASKVAPLFEAANPTAAIYCKTGECEIRVTAREATEQAAEAACNARIAEFKEILGAAAYDVDVPALEYTVVRALREHHLHAATAESCTGGMIAERLTNVPGSSEVFGFGFVTICGGLNINIGTLNQRSIAGMFRAGAKANALGHVVLLDPVGAGASALRTNTAVELMEKVKFTVLRGNISGHTGIDIGAAHR